MKLIFWILIVVLLFFLYIKLLEHYSIYFPSRDIAVTPEAVGLTYEDVYVKTADNNKLHGWFIPHKEAGYTILFCHGNAGNISHRMDKLFVFYSLHFNTFIFDYRGYGKSQSFPTENGLYKDADAVYRYLTEKRGIPQEKIILYGESLGGAVIINLALSTTPYAVITEETFSSVKDMARIYYSFIPTVFVSNKYDSISKIKDISCPKLIIHSKEDDIVPFSLGEKLYSNASSPKQFLIIHGSHNTAFFDSLDDLKKGIQSFITN